MKDFSSVRKAGQVRNNNLSLSNLNTLFGSNNPNGNNKTNFLNNLDNAGEAKGLAVIEKNSNIINANLKAQKDQNINNINITNNTNNFLISNLNEERDKNTLKERDICINLQSKKTIEIKNEDKQQIEENGKLKEIEEKLNKFYSNGIYYIEYIFYNKIINFFYYYF